MIIIHDHYPTPCRFSSITQIISVILSSLKKHGWENSITIKLSLGLFDSLVIQHVMHMDPHPKEFKV